MQEYFATIPDPERGWALAALTGELSFAEAKPSQVRDLARPRAALSGTVRLAGRARRGARHRRIADLLPADAGAAARRGRSRSARSERLPRRMEMGRHPGAAGRARRPEAALFALRRRYR